LQLNYDSGMINRVSKESRGVSRTIWTDNTLIPHPHFAEGIYIPYVPRQEPCWEEEKKWNIQRYLL
jgi:hypothetical protein